jgi:two-component system alkaline phosphatase synthesis response regulator PhoP
MNTGTIRILLADYDLDTLELYRKFLEQDGYQIMVASNGSDVMNKAILLRPHLIIMDLMNADFSCYKTINNLRNSPMFANITIVIFTSLYDEAIQHEGISSQVNGFIRKNISEDLFLAHVRRYLKLMKPDDARREVLEFANLSIDVEGYVVRKDSNVIGLAKREFELLLYLASEPHRIFTRGEISRQMFGRPILENDRILDVYIAKLRNKIGKNHIQTMKGVGYSFVA